MFENIAVVVIGRNEGDRFKACLASLPEGLGQVVYVDSGSTDGSVDVAKAFGADIVELDMTMPFTAARARNAGLAVLGSDFRFVQLMDGDCSVREGWFETATAALDNDENLAVVCGRRRERHPEASIYNLLCDLEWDTPVGPSKACGGDAMMRLQALHSVGAYRDDLIAGEEPELCVRLRQSGWSIARLDAEMTWHDAAMTRFAQWWRRTTRAGHAFAEGAALHGAPPERHWVRETRRALVWGAVLPAAIIVAALWKPWLGVGLMLLYPAQFLRLGLRDERPHRWHLAWFSVVGKFAEAQGAVSYYLSRLKGRRRQIIEYK